MQYRKFGKLDWEVSALGFGAMRLPVIDGNPANVDEPEATRMIRYAIDHGLNYIDTAYMYHSGKSEGIVGRILKDGYREKTKVATKLPVTRVGSYDDFDRLLNEQLERLQIEKVDFYLLHGLDKHDWRKARDLGVLRWAEGAMADGRFDHFGFSFHDDLETFKEIVDGYDNWTFCQIQYNYMDTDYQAGREGMEYAAGKGLGIIAMEPLRGGKLTGKPPEQITKVWDSAPNQRSAAEWGLMWVWNQPEVAMALSGMSTMEHVVENVSIAERSGPDILTPEELRFVGRLQASYRGLTPVLCTDCGYCIPCPEGVDIPRIFQIYNEAIMYDDPRTGRFRYRGPNGLAEEQRADRCIECGECLDICPQEIPVPDWLKEAHALLGPRPG
jgi:predicted aldo/keto reductase-like oxidoreductase